MSQIPSGTPTPTPPSILGGVSFAPTPTPTPPPPTAAQSSAQAIVAGVAALLTFVVNERIRLYNLCWNNPQAGCSPPQIAAQLGNLLVSAFENDAALVEFIAAQAAANGFTLPAAATAGIPSQWAFTPSPANDGTGTITAAPAQS